VQDLNGLGFEGLLSQTAVHTVVGWGRLESSASKRTFP
jgi:hypothetical protein